MPSRVDLPIAPPTAEIFSGLAGPTASVSILWSDHHAVQQFPVLEKSNIGTAIRPKPDICVFLGIRVIYREAKFHPCEVQVGIPSGVCKSTSGRRIFRGTRDLLQSQILW